MSDFNYLVALALIEQNGNRIMPIGGKSLKGPINESDLSDQNVEKIALELLTRVIERSDDGSLKRVYGDKSILICQIPIEIMQNNLPSLKNNWINNGDTELFLKDLSVISKGIWTLNFVRYEGLKWNKL